MKQVLAALRSVNRKGYVREVENVVLHGFFRHQGRSHPNYSIVLAKDPGGDVDGQGNYAVLSARPTIIQSRAYGDLGKPVRRIDIAEGSLIRVDGKLYEVRDDRRYSDPRLVPVA